VVWNSVDAGLGGNMGNMGIGLTLQTLQVNFNISLGTAHLLLEYLNLYEVLRT
jgi:hypothetical protein